MMTVSPEFLIVDGDGRLCSGVDCALEVGDILEVWGREQDGTGQTLLHVFPWWDRDLFLLFMSDTGVLFR